jgi:hypothetical protein
MTGLRWLCEERDLEAQEALDSYESCNSSNHETDELLLSYICASPFQKWKASFGSILWCQKKFRADIAHDSIAACILKQAINTCVTSPPEILYFRCQAGFGNAASGPSLPLEQESRELWGPEIILKSFISQAEKRGFVSAKISTMNTSDSTLLVYLVETLASMLETRDCSVFLVVDSMEYFRETEINDFLVSLSYLTGKNAKKYSVLLGGETTVELTKGLSGLPFVNEETEVKGKALFYDDSCHTSMCTSC